MLFACPSQRGATWACSHHTTHRVACAAADLLYVLRLQRSQTMGASDAESRANGGPVDCDSEVAPVKGFALAKLFGKLTKLHTERTDEVWLYHKATGLAIMVRCVRSGMQRSVPLHSC